MMYKWGHPVATLHSDRGDNASLLQNDIRHKFCKSNDLLQLMLGRARDISFESRLASVTSCRHSNAVGDVCVYPILQLQTALMITDMPSYAVYDAHLSLFSWFTSSFFIHQSIGIEYSRIGHGHGRMAMRLEIRLLDRNKEHGISQTRPAPEQIDQYAVPVTSLEQRRAGGELLTDHARNRDHCQAAVVNLLGLKLPELGRLLLLRRRGKSMRQARAHALSVSAAFGKLKGT
eukprot:6214740-Pleurochrysis_carterae.AAC.7